MNWLRKHKNAILIATVGGFIVSTFVGFGLYVGFGGGALRSVAEVNAEKIPYSRYVTLYNRAVNDRRDKEAELTPEILNQLKQEVIQSLIQESVFYQQAEKYGIQVTDTELAQNIARVPAFQKEGKFDAQSYLQALRFGLRTTPQEFEETQRRQIAIDKLQFLIRQGIKISDKELQQEYLESKGSWKDFEKEMEEFQKNLLNEKSAQILSRWYQQLGRDLKVEVHLDKIERGGR